MITAVEKDSMGHTDDEHLEYAMQRRWPILLKTFAPVVVEEATKTTSLAVNCGSAPCQRSRQVVFARSGAATVLGSLARVVVV
ncbi:hypothetical protein [Natronobeatus ordinarius]|uniref:hypothetical protein n=1 Tax=Natronobeatus ordinarius TaxID=2963433 RepID=UPI0020CF4927|nr:hypothetical protein [Natronobeatus ordinarius]